MNQSQGMKTALICVLLALGLDGTAGEDFDVGHQPVSSLLKRYSILNGSIFTPASEEKSGVEFRTQVIQPGREWSPILVQGRRCRMVGDKNPFSSKDRSFDVGHRYGVALFSLGFKSLEITLRNDRHRPNGFDIICDLENRKEADRLTLREIEDDLQGVLRFYFKSSGKR